MAMIAAAPLLMTLAVCGGMAQMPPQEIKNEIIRLWDAPPPGTEGNQEKDIPTLTRYKSFDLKTEGTAVIICPGGGYAGLAMDHEGRQVAEWFSQRGIAAFILQYRLPANGYRHPIPGLDAQRAIRLVRFNADKWGIHPNKIGILGFSAGGHLASTAGTHFDKSFGIEGYMPDGIDAVSARPDFMILIYPVISMEDGITHKGSKNNLLGPNPSPDLIELLTNHKQVTPQTPPTFLVHADDDKGVVAENSICFYEALRKNHVPAEMHIYLKGGHGFGMRPSAGPASQWPDECLKWLRQIHMAPSAEEK